ncbi:hypothetical protein H6P81_006115 [Aristolochia fimbriata]|uniref:Enoyl reductase (ER) domain-containing protein n=1 Tax=Aristolochia fimbriata TaxID=158543 RepID=A0AAV7F051_ARIFI|nr:hypothetical protein H6P81_006115 [Aristolochia fimbriata]
MHKIMGLTALPRKNLRSTHSALSGMPLIAIDDSGLTAVECDEYKATEVPARAATLLDDCGREDPLGISLQHSALLASGLVLMAGKVMQEVQYDGYGGGAAGLKYVEVPVPSPKKDEVLLKVEATALNPVDWKIQKGMLRPLLLRRFPFIPGEIFAVIGVGGGDNGGGLAEFAVSSEKLTVKRPPEISASHAAGLNIAGLTALHALTEVAGVKLDGSENRKNILITAASGGVGHYEVQLAKLGNTHITATCGAHNLES